MIHYPFLPRGFSQYSGKPINLYNCAYICPFRTLAVVFQNNLGSGFSPAVLLLSPAPCLSGRVSFWIYASFPAVIVVALSLFFSKLHSLGSRIVSGKSSPNPHEESSENGVSGPFLGYPDFIQGPLPPCMSSSSGIRSDAGLLDLHPLPASSRRYQYPFLSDNGVTSHRLQAGSALCQL